MFLLADTSSSSSTTITSTETPDASHWPVVVPSNDGPFAIIDRMPPGQHKLELLQKQFEVEVKRQREIHDMAIATEEKRKDDEHRTKLQAIRDDFDVDQERKNEAHQLVVAKLKDEHLAVHDQRVQSRQRAEAEISRINEEIKERKLAELRRQFDNCTDDFQRGYLMSVRAMIENASTSVKLAINAQTPEAPLPLTQAVIGETLSDLQLPNRFNVLNTTMDTYLTVSAFVSGAYPHVKLMGEEVKTLGGLVARAHDRATAGRGLRIRSTEPSGTGYAVRSYSIMDLLNPPLKQLIEDFVKGVVADREASRGRKRNAEEAAIGPHPNPFAGTMHQFVVPGVPV